MAILETRNLTKVFPKAAAGAVDGVSLVTREGEFLVLLGPSGSGKTTLLRMIAGLEEPTSGEILIGGESRQRPDAPGARDRDGLPELRALPAPDRFRKHRLPAQGAARAEGGAAAQGGMGGGPARDRTPARAPAPGALRRRAPARGPGARDRARAVALPAGRAALQPRREAARLRPRRARAVSEAGRHDHRLRHARPGRSDGDGRPRRRDEPRARPTGRHARARCTTIRRTRSSRRFSARPR